MIHAVLEHTEQKYIIIEKNMEMNFRKYTKCKGKNQGGC